MDSESEGRLALTWTHWQSWEMGIHWGFGLLLLQWRVTPCLLRLAGRHLFNWYLAPQGLVSSTQFPVLLICPVPVGCRKLALWERLCPGRWMVSVVPVQDGWEAERKPSDLLPPCPSVPQLSFLPSPRIFPPFLHYVQVLFCFVFHCKGNKEEWGHSTLASTGNSCFNCSPQAF